MQKLNCDIAIQETRQTVNEVIKLLDYIFCNSDGRNKFLGTWFVVNRKLKRAILQFKAISDKMCYMRFKGKHQKLSLLNIHAPSEDKKNEVKE